MIYVIGDCHLMDDKGSISWDRNRRGMYDFLEELALKKDDVLIQTGDYFDAPRHRGSTNKAGLKAIQYASEHAGSVYMLAGNHEQTRYQGSNLDSLDIFPNVKVVKDIFSLNLDGTIIGFLPFIEGFPMGSKYMDRVDELFGGGSEKISIFFGHHFFQWNAMFESSFLDTSRLASYNYDYCIQGHVHNFDRHGRDICIGSVCPVNKGERHNKSKYLVLDKDSVLVKDIPSGIFSQFVEVDYPITVKVAPKDFMLVKVKCKKEEKYLIEQDLLSKYPNIYDISWEMPVEASEHKLDIRTDDDLMNQFFEDNKYSKLVKDLFWRYYVG